MPIPIEKVEREQPAYQFMFKLEGIHRRASLGCILPYRRPRASRGRFAVILKILVDDLETSKTSQMLDPTINTFFGLLATAQNI